MSPYSTRRSGGVSLGIWLQGDRVWAGNVARAGNVGLTGSAPAINNGLSVYA